jgi:hypothetical protein
MVSRRRHDDRPIGRRASTLAPRRRILVVCEGKETEPRYFGELQREVRNPRVHVEIAREGGDPLNIVQAAVALRDSARRDAKRQQDDNLLWDEVWGVFDVDEHRRLAEAKRLAAENGVCLAVSNPCFELWALLHFQDQRAHIERWRVRGALQRHMIGYDKTLDFTKMHTGYQAAVRRANALDREAEQHGDPERNPTTGVPRLTELIRLG